MKSNNRSPSQRKHWASLSPWMKKKIRSNKQSQFARRIRREFSYTCCSCQSTKRLHAHHMFQQHLFEDKKSDISNGILLCSKCHTKVHNLFNKNEINYWILMKEYNSLRKPIKSLKGLKRNPSGFDYDKFWLSIKPEALDT